MILIVSVVIEVDDPVELLIDLVVSGLFLLGGSGDPRKSGDRFTLGDSGDHSSVGESGDREKEGEDCGGDLCEIFNVALRIIISFSSGETITVALCLTFGRTS